MALVDWPKVTLRGAWAGILGAGNVWIAAYVVRHSHYISQYKDTAAAARAQAASAQADRIRLAIAPDALDGSLAEATTIAAEATDAAAGLLTELGRFEISGLAGVSLWLLGLSFVYSRLVKKPEAVAEKSGTPAAGEATGARPPASG